MSGRTKNWQRPKTRKKSNSEEYKDKYHCDILCLFLQFPLYWFSVPAIMKGWIDRVLAQGFAFTLKKMYNHGVFKVSLSHASLYPTQMMIIQFSKHGDRAKLSLMLVYSSWFYSINNKTCSDVLFWRKYFIKYGSDMNILINNGI